MGSLALMPVGFPCWCPAASESEAEASGVKVGLGMEPPISWGAAPTASLQGDTGALAAAWLCSHYSHTASISVSPSEATFPVDSN